MDLETIRSNIETTVNKLKETNPLVPAISNTVTQEFIANICLALKASPIIIYLDDEARSMARVANTLVINLGTFYPFLSTSILAGAEELTKKGKSFVLDPVGIGIGTLRTKTLNVIKRYKPQIIRANASETIALAKLWDLDAGKNAKGPKGVDNQDEVLAAKTAALSLAKYTGGVVAVSGAEDLITDGKQILKAYGGSHFLRNITGAGDALAMCIASYYAASKDPLSAALAGTNTFNLASSRAEETASGPSSFETKFIDTIYELKAKDIANNKLEIKEI